MTDVEKLLVRIGTARDAIGRKAEQTSLDYMIEGVLMECSVMLKEQEAVEPFHRCIGKEFNLIEDSHYDYCPYCGKPITWTKQEGR